jgi:predicted aminopeptidase
MLTVKAHRSKVSCVLSVVLLTLPVGGCGVDWAYLIPAAAGQLGLLRHSVPVSQAIENGELTEEQVAKLELIRDARIYARDVIGLNVEDNYTTFYDSGGLPVAHNVSASRKDAFKPKLWKFPIVGTVPYLGYFDLARAEAKVRKLRAQDFDVFMYEIDAYSGLGYFPNPILSPMLERSEVNLANTVIHELLHSTIWRVNDTTFNESLATFFGRAGAIQYFTDRHADKPELILEAVAVFEDTDRYSEFALSLFNDLDAFYSSDLSSEAKISGREAIYQAGRDRFAIEVQPLMNRPERYNWVADLPTNNAYMLGVRRYNLDLDVFEQVFAATGEDWAASLGVFQAAADASDSYAYLQTWLASPGSDSPAQPSKARVIPERVLRGPCPASLPTTILCPE